MASARELVIADDPAAWARLGFAPGEDGAFALGGLRVRLAGRAAGAGVVALAVDGLARERPDGLPVVAADADAGSAVAPGGGDAAGSGAVAPGGGDAAGSGAVAPAGGDAAGSGAVTPGGGVAADRDAAAADGAAHPNGALAIDHLVAFTDDRDRTAAALAAAGGDVRRRGAPPELPAPMAFVRFGELVVEVAQAGGAPRFWGLTVTVADLDALAGPLLGEARSAVQPGRRIATVRRGAGLSLALALITPRQDSNPRADRALFDNPPPVG